VSPKSAVNLRANSWAGIYSARPSAWGSGLGWTTPENSHSAGRPGFGVVHRPPRLSTQGGSPLHVGRAAPRGVRGRERPRTPSTSNHHPPQRSVSSALPLLEALVPLLLLVLPVLLGGGAAARSRSPSRQRRTAARLLFSHAPLAMARTSFATGRASGGRAARARPRGHSFGADVASAVVGVFFGVHQGENTHSARPGQMPCDGALSGS
jgi:hypothetical protein